LAAIFLHYVFFLTVVLKKLPLGKNHGASMLTDYCFACRFKIIGFIPGLTAMLFNLQKEKTHRHTSF
jgi:hypothetical protein